jgi:hypothetical protein
MNRTLSLVLFLGLFAAGVALVLWLSRHYRAKASILDAKAACAWAALSFVFVGAGLVAATLMPSGQTVVGGGKELPPDVFPTVFATVPAAVFHLAALLAALGLWIGAAIQLVASWRSPSGGTRRQDAARLAIYGVGAFLVAIVHFALLRLGPDLLK